MQICPNIKRYLPAPPPPKKKTGENQDSDLPKRQQHTIGMFSVDRKEENNFKDISKM
jgi:hypothetical protein